MVVIRHPGHAVVVLLLQMVHPCLVCDVDLLDGLEVVLLSLGATLAECLDLLAEGVSLDYQLLLVAGVLVRVLSDLNRGVRDVDLQFAPLDLGVMEKLLVHNYVFLEVIYNLLR